MNGIHIDEELCLQAIDVLNSKGLELSEVLNNYLKKIISDDDDELLNSLQSTKPKRPMKDFRGIFKGRITLTDDFNETPDCFKDYMK